MRGRSINPPDRICGWHPAVQQPPPPARSPVEVGADAVGRDRNQVKGKESPRKTSEESVRRERQYVRPRKYQDGSTVRQRSDARPPQVSVIIAPLLEMNYSPIHNPYT